MDLLVPFVGYCIPNKEGMPIDNENIKQQMKSEFGIAEMPDSIVNNLVKRYARKYPNCIVYQNKHAFVGKNKPDNSEFEKRRQLIDLQIEKVSDALSNYITENAWGKSKKNPTELLILFFQEYGLRLCYDVNELNRISFSQGKEAYLVAKFILWINSTNPVLFQSLIDLVKGFFSYSAIYQIDEGDKQNQTSKLKDVQCFLDCSLLISLLGHDGKESQNATKNLIKLLRENHGKICAFKHTVEEAKSLLRAYANSKDKFSFDLQGLKARRLPDVTIRALAFNLENEVAQLSINIFDFSGEDISDVKTVNSSIYSSSRTSSYDLKSLAGVEFIRGKKRQSLSNSIENCGALLVTQDFALVHTCQKNRARSSCDFTLAKLSTDIITLLWLQSFSACPDIPKELLLSKAAAAITLSDDVRKKAIEITDQLANETITTEMIQVLRTDMLDEQFLAEMTSNDVDNVTPESIKVVLLKQMESEITDIRAEERAKYEVFVREMEEKHNQEKQENVKNEERRKKSQEAERQSRINQRAEDIANKHFRFLKKIGFGIVAILFVIFSKEQASSLYHDFVSSENINFYEWAKLIVFIFVAIYGIFCFFEKGLWILRPLFYKGERRYEIWLRSRYEKNVRKFDV